MWITKEEEFVGSYATIHLHKTSRHVPQLRQIGNKTSYVILHFLFHRKKGEVSPSEFVVNKKFQPKPKLQKYNEHTWGWRKPSESSSSSLISILAWVRETWTSRDQALSNNWEYLHASMSGPSHILLIYILQLLNNSLPKRTLNWKGIHSNSSNLYCKWW